MSVLHTYLIELNILVAINWHKFKQCDTYMKKNTHPHICFQHRLCTALCKISLMRGELPLEGNLINSYSTILKELPNNIQLQNTQRKRWKELIFTIQSYMPLELGYSCNWTRVIYPLHKSSLFPPLIYPFKFSFLF